MKKLCISTWLLWVMGLSCIVSQAVMAEDAYPAQKCDTSSDPFRRCILFKNELSFPVWPVLTAPLKSNGGSADGVGLIVVSKGKDAGIPPGGTVKLYVPKQGEMAHGWYNAARIAVLTFDPRALTTMVADPNITILPVALDEKKACPEETKGSCWAGEMKSNFWLDAPNQLLEFTTWSKDWRSKENGGHDHGAYPNPDDPAGVPFIDYDVSYVDHVYLPVAITLDDGGATRYAGTTLDFATFTKSVNKFAEFSTAKWQEYAVTGPDFWSSKNNLVYQVLDGQQYSRIPSGAMIVDGVLHPDFSSLYKPSAPSGTKPQCNLGDPGKPNPDWPACSHLAGDCCPNGDGTMLACCGMKNYMINNTKPVGETKQTNPSLEAIWDRWDTWLNKTPCANIDAIKTWPNDKAADPSIFDKQGFCDQFQASVKYLWNIFSTSPDAIKTCAKFDNDPQQHNYCLMSYAIGFKVPEDNSGNREKIKGQLPETIQGVMRNVPYGDASKKEKRYQWDKFLHYWAPVDSIFNLNPFVSLVKHKADGTVNQGVEAKSGYSFSIDDQWSNYQDWASSMIVDIGGSSTLLNRDSFDPYEQFVLSVGPGWDHGTICGRPAQFKKTAMAFTFSFWRNGVAQDHCDIVLYGKPGNDSYASFRLLPTDSKVTDTWTGLKYQVKGFKQDPAYCKPNSSADHQLDCDPEQTKIGPRTLDNAGGGAEVVYLSVTESERPSVMMTTRALPLK